jgi:serine/threonine-protein kinase HipA
MKRVIQVYLGDELRWVGTLRYDAQGTRESASFEYASEWLTAKERFALEPRLPLVTGPQFHPKSVDGSAFSGVFADTEPDGWGRRVIQRDRAKRRKSQRSSIAPLGPPNSMDFLLAVDDVSRVGAIRLKDENGIFQRSNEEGRRGIPPLLELKHLVAASRAVETNSETAADLEYLRGRGTSLGGLRPKCSVIDDDGRLAIGKFPSVSDERAVTKGEVLALRLAKICGIQTAEAKLVESDGAPVALIRRFDRTPNGGRLLFISAATLLSVDANDTEQHTYTEIVDTLRIYGADAQRDIEELWRRIAFYILINNVDDHLLNLGLLHVAGGKWKLSPA